MRHLRDEVKRRLEFQRGDKTRRWALWLRNLLLLVAVVILMRYFGSKAQPEPLQNSPAANTQEVKQ